MTTWNEDRKYVLEAIKRIDDRVEKLFDGQVGLKVKVAGIGAVMGLLGGAICKMLL
jgi:hypothetical protein